MRIHRIKRYSRSAKADKGIAYWLFPPLFCLLTTNMQTWHESNTRSVCCCHFIQRGRTFLYQLEFFFVCFLRNLNFLRMNSRAEIKGVALHNPYIPFYQTSQCPCALQIFVNKRLEQLRTLTVELCKKGKKHNAAHFCIVGTNKQSAPFNQSRHDRSDVHTGATFNAFIYIYTVYWIRGDVIKSSY